MAGARVHTYTHKSPTELVDLYIKEIYTEALSPTRTGTALHNNDNDDEIFRSV